MSAAPAAVATRDCITCEVDMKATRRNYPYVGFPGVTLADTAVWTCPECGNQETDIPNKHLLPKVLAGALVNKPQRLLAAEIKWLRQFMGWTGVEFARRIGVTPVAVSRWENGRPAGAMVDRLVRLLVAVKQPNVRYELASILKGADPLRGKLLRAGDDWEFVVVVPEGNLDEPRTGAHGRKHVRTRRRRTARATGDPR